MNFTKLLLIICAGAVSGRASDIASMQGPVSGYLFDSQLRAIRPMMGIPGAAYLGPVVASDLDAASVSPDGSTALVVKAGQLILYRGLASAKPAATALTNGVAPDRFAWGPGLAAVTYSSATREAYLYSDLSAASPSAVTVDVSSIQGQVAAMAFDGVRVILAVSSANSSAIFTITPKSAPQTIASAGKVTAMALAGADLYFADGQASQIWQVRNYATQPAPVVFAGDSSISSPAALQVSADGARLYAANAGTRTLCVYQLSTRLPIESLPLSFTPTTLDRFGSSSIYALNGSGPVQASWFVLTDQMDKRAVYFVPAGRRPNTPRPVHYKPL